MTSGMREPTYWILAALAGGRRHGYAILTEVSELTDGRLRLNVTTLYAALDRLAREGLVAGDGEEVVSGRRRRYVVLTAAGASALAGEAARLADAGRRASARLVEHGWAAPRTATTGARS